jgi:ribonuclease VapC
VKVFDASALLAFLLGEDGIDDAEWAAGRWRPGEGLSLADRLCLALGERTDAVVWTADRQWAREPRVRTIR